MYARKFPIVLFLTAAICAGQSSSRHAAVPDLIEARYVSEESGLRVLSLNLHGIKDEVLLLKTVEAAGADLMLFQEVVRPAGGRSSAVEGLAQALGFDVFFARAFCHRNGDEEGLAIVSRYPLRERAIMRLPRVSLRWKSRRRIALAASVQTATGVVRIYNVHLDSRVNIGQRLQQLQPVTDAAGTLTGPVLIGGDFNTNPYGWFQHTLPLPGPDQAARMAEHMRSLGYDSAVARRAPTSDWLRMQLDWLFAKGSRWDGAEIRPVKFSDHHALRARLMFRQAGTTR